MRSSSLLSGTCKNSPFTRCISAAALLWKYVDHVRKTH
jgi:hypothetical protein